MHDLPLITTIATAFTAAWLLGLLTQRLGLSPIVGYLLAGVLIGKHTPGYVGDIGLAQQLAEVGVILLMFGVGLHFHLKDLLAVRSVAIPGAIGQSLVATALGMAVFAAFGLPLQSGAVLGLALAVASTVVLMRVLMDANVLNSPQGHVAVGWLLVEDVFTVIVLVLIPILGSGGGDGHGAAGLGLWASLGLALLKLAALIAIVMLGGSRVIPWVLVQVARLRSRELFTLTVLVFSIAIAAASYFFFGASMALGAFLAGMVVAQSPVSHQAAADALPMRDAFAVIFFVSVGMLFNPVILIQQPLLILAVLGIILIAKPLTALVIVALLGHSPRTALTVAVGLAQVGEFSFILSEVARKYGLMSDEGLSLLVAGAILSITLNPMLFRSIGGIEAWLRRRPRLWNLLNERADRRLRRINAATSSQIEWQDDDGGRRAVVVGFGPVGRAVDRLLREAGLSTVVIDLNMDTVLELNAAGQAAVFGDAAREGVLEQAGVRRAGYLVLTLPHSSERATVVMTAKEMNPRLRILVRARYLREREELDQAGATGAVFEEAEAAVALARMVLAHTGASREVIQRSVRDLQMRLILDNVSNLGTQTVRGVMVPWTRVHRISRSASLQDVLREVAKQRFSRWPVVDPATDRPIGYLLTKDLIAEALAAPDWTRLIRPIRTVSPAAGIESLLLELQRDGTTVAIVEDAGRPVGMITVEDILEQVVGRIEDEYPRGPRVRLLDALTAGRVVLDVAAQTAEQAILELASAIDPGRLPPNADLAGRALAREREVSTDVGYGVAIPHARCPNLRDPVLVFGRSAEGVIFSARSTEPVRLILLLVTPAEQPDLQVRMLGRIAALASQPEARERLRGAFSAADVLEVFAEADSGAVANQLPV